MLNRKYDCFIACESDFKDADIVMFGAPFDGTVSNRPGTRFAAKAIRAESFGIETYSPYSNEDLCDKKIMDAGDLELPFGNTEKTLEILEEQVNKILESEKIPLMIGGEHLVSLPAIKACFNKYPNLCVLHFDAHTDLRDEYLGEKFSHAAVIRRVWDFVGDNRIYQFGIRSGEKYEFEFAKQHTFLQKFDLSNFDEAIEELKNKPVYFTLDLDVLDPSVFPGTGTPEAGGISYMELQNAILKLKKLNIVGCDVNELSPPYDLSGVSTAVACKIVREILLCI